VKQLSTQVKNILKRREECETYLTQVYRHHWSRESPMKIDEIGAFVGYGCG
jgi:hypothetical protein